MCGIAQKTDSVGVPGESIPFDGTLWWILGLDHSVYRAFTSCSFFGNKAGKTKTLEDDRQPQIDFTEEMPDCFANLSSMTTRQLNVFSDHAWGKLHSKEYHDAPSADRAALDTFLFKAVLVSDKLNKRGGFSWISPEKPAEDKKRHFKESEFLTPDDENGTENSLALVTFGDDSASVVMDSSEDAREMIEAVADLLASFFTAGYGK